MLDNLEKCLVAVRDQTQGRLPSSIRVAAQAALLLIDKYFSLTDECEVYAIAMGMSMCLACMIRTPYSLSILVMSPYKKLQWFRDKGRTSAQVEEIRRLVINRWEESYQSTAGPTDSSVPAAHPNMVAGVCKLCPLSDISF